MFKSIETVFQKIEEVFQEFEDAVENFGVKEPLPNLIPIAYEIEKTHGIKIESRGYGNWAVVDAGTVLTKKLGWEMEPRPASRSRDFIASTRWKSVNEALTAFVRWRKKNTPV
jgi:hypothetical protein